MTTIGTARITPATQSPPVTLCGHDITIRFVNKDTGDEFCPRNLMAAEVAYDGRWQITLDYDCEGDHLTAKWIESQAYLAYDLFVTFGQKYADPANIVKYCFPRCLKLISWRFSAKSDDVASGRLVLGAFRRDIDGFIG